ncbi:MAG: hypothetical protein PUB69_06980 [Desulfovibrionaceae bacterium]|nr:hypothetical protein [Desulfovibrionaceae bacterium]
MKSDNSPDSSPVSPSGMQVMLRYICPRCGQGCFIPAPLRETELHCRCGQIFTAAPVDEYSMAFMEILLDDGRAAVKQEYL